MGNIFTNSSRRGSTRPTLTAPAAPLHRPSQRISRSDTRWPRRLLKPRRTPWGRSGTASGLAMDTARLITFGGPRNRNDLRPDNTRYGLGSGPLAAGNLILG